MALVLVLWIFDTAVKYVSEIASLECSKHRRAINNKKIVTSIPIIDKNLITNINVDRNGEY